MRSYKLDIFSVQTDDVRVQSVTVCCLLLLYLMSYSQFSRCAAHSTSRSQVSGVEMA